MTFDSPLSPVGAAESPAVRTARRILDHFAVPARLESIRDSLWRGGTLHFHVDADPAAPGHPADIRYELSAAWDTAVFHPEEIPGEPAAPRALARPGGGVLAGRWQRRRAGYSLSIGIHAAGQPAAIYVRGLGLRYVVPYLGRGDDQVLRALDSGLAEYTSAFLAACHPVPRAAAADADRLRQYGV